MIPNKIPFYKVSDSNSDIKLQIIKNNNEFCISGNNDLLNKIYNEFPYIFSKPTQLKIKLINISKTIQEIIEVLKYN